MPGCGLRSRAVRGSLADRKEEGKKSFCCVTTRRRNLWVLNGLGRGLGPLAARAFRLGVPGFGVGVLAMFGLPPRRLPAVDLPLAFRLLAVALVPTPRLVLAPAPFAQADPRARSAPSGLRTAFSLTLAGAHGRFVSQGKARGECVSILPGAIKTRTKRLLASLRLLREQDREQNGFRSGPEQDDCFPASRVLREQDREQDGFSGRNKTIAFQPHVFSENQTALDRRPEQDDPIKSRNGGSHQTLANGSDNLLGPTRTRSHGNGSA